MNVEVHTLPVEVMMADMRRQLLDRPSVIFVARGWSMRPFVEHERDKVRLGRVPARGIQVDDVVLARTADRRYVLHRVVHVAPDGLLTLRGDGNVCGTEMAHTADVIGVVIGFYRPRGWRGPQAYYSTEGTAWQRYSRWWTSLSPRGRQWWLRLYRLCFRLHLIAH